MTRVPRFIVAPTAAYHLYRLVFRRKILAVGALRNRSCRAPTLWAVSLRGWGHGCLLQAGVVADLTEHQTSFSRKLGSKERREGIKWI
jgi:hypothetical protein